MAKDFITILLSGNVRPLPTQVATQIANRFYFRDQVEDAPDSDYLIDAPKHFIAVIGNAKSYLNSAVEISCFRWIPFAEYAAVRKESAHRGLERATIKRMVAEVKIVEKYVSAEAPELNGTCMTYPDRDGAVGVHFVPNDTDHQAMGKEVISMFCFNETREEGASRLLTESSLDRIFKKDPS